MKTKIILLIISLAALTSSTVYAVKDVEQEPTDEALMTEEAETSSVCAPQITFVEEEKPILKKKSNRISLGEFTLTAYCSCQKCCGKWALNRPKDEHGNEIVYGSNGDVLKQGVSVAVDPKVIPMGTKIYINNHEYIAQDTGGAIKGNKIDVYFNNHQEALDFGVRYANVEVDAK